MNPLVLTVILIVCTVGLSSAQRRSGRQEEGGYDRPPPPGGRGGPPPEGPDGPPPEGPDRPHGGPHDEHHWGPGGRRRGPPPPPSILHMFPSCNATDEAIRQKHEEMWKSKQIGPGAKNCEGKDHKECMRKDMNTVRCAVSVEPSQDCVQDVMKYLQGSACGTDGKGTENPDQEWEAIKKQ